MLEGHLQPDHIHMLISIPPKYAVSQVVGYMKGKSAIHICADLPWAEEELQWNALLRGYYVSTIGTDEEVVRVHIRDQEKEDHRLEQLSLFK